MPLRITIALAGNPNCGKTTVFNAMTGARQHIANYPGVTVEKKSGRVHHRGVEIEVVDLPGIYSLTAYSLEEIVARDYLIQERPDLVVDIVDASNLDRNLYLTVQLQELGIPLIIALNMIDVAASRDILVDEQALATLLNTPVVPMIARSKRGITELLDAVVESAEAPRPWHPAALSYGRDLDQSLADIQEIIRSSRIYDSRYPARWRALKCLEGDSQILALLKRDPERGARIRDICRRTRQHILDTLEEEPEGLIADHRYGYITGITRRAVKRKTELRLNLSDKIDKVVTNRFVGPLIMIGVLYGIYLFTFWISEVPVAWLELFFGQIKAAVTWVLPEGPLQSLIVSGIIDGVGGVMGFLPIILFMFCAIAVMEDTGYMARVAYMLDRVLRWFGLHGNSVMALIVSGGISGGCAVPGALATRTLRDPKERIATLLVVPFMNCGAKLPVYAVLIGAFFAKHEARMLFILTLLSWGFALFAAKILRSTVLKGPKTPFVMELPPYRLPTLRGLAIHTWERTWHYIRKAGTVILGFSVLLWAMMTYPGLSAEQRRAFEDESARLTESLLQQAAIRPWIPDRRALREFEALFDDPTRKEMAAAGGRFGALLEAVKYLAAPNSGEPRHQGDLPLDAAGRYLEYRGKADRVQMRLQQAALERTVAGWIGQRLEGFTRPLGFDYRVNIALVGGFAAKEVIVSTLGTAYSLGDVAPGHGGSIAAKLSQDPHWNPLQAFTLILFTMLYVPCFVTLISIRKESSWQWAGFSIAFNLLTAYVVALAVRQAGLALGLGVP